MQEKDIKKIAVIDIDGVLNYYPQPWLDYIAEYYGKEYDTLREAKARICYHDYKMLKDCYRQSKEVLLQECRENAKELFDYLHENNYLIYIVTARPLFKHDLLSTTIQWLKENQLEYDYIYCSQKKDFTLSEKFGHIDVVIEDNFDNIDNIYKLNGDARYFVVLNKENKENESIIPNIEKITNLNEVKEVLEYDKKQNYCRRCRQNW